MCVVDSDDRKWPMKTIRLVIKLIIFFAVIAFAVTLIAYGVTPYAAGLFLPVVITAAVKAVRIVQDKDDPRDGGAAVPVRVS